MSAAEASTNEGDELGRRVDDEFADEDERSNLVNQLNKQSSLVAEERKNVCETEDERTDNEIFENDKGNLMRVVNNTKEGDPFLLTKRSTKM